MIAMKKVRKSDSTKANKMFLTTIAGKLSLAFCGRKKSNNVNNSRRTGNHTRQFRHRVFPNRV